MGISTWVQEHSIGVLLSIGGTIDPTQSNPSMEQHNTVAKIT